MPAGASTAPPKHPFNHCSLCLSLSSAEVQDAGADGCGAGARRRRQQRLQQRPRRTEDLKGCGSREGTDATRPPQNHPARHISPPTTWHCTHFPSCTPLKPPSFPYQHCCRSYCGRPPAPPKPHLLHTCFSSLHALPLPLLTLCTPPLYPSSNVVLSPPVNSAPLACLEQTARRRCYIGGVWAQ